MERTETSFRREVPYSGVQPDITGLTSDTLREWNENAWLHRLGPMLKDVPDFDRLWKEWVKTFHELVKDTK